MDDRDVARLLGLTRMAIGGVCALLPRRAIAVWGADPEPSPSARLAMRGLGARDFAIGLGTVVALEGDGNPARWLEAGAVADAGDAVAVLSSWAQLPGVKRALWLVGGVGGAALSMRLASALDETS